MTTAIVVDHRLVLMVTAQAYGARFKSFLRLVQLFNCSWRRDKAALGCGFRFLPFSPLGKHPSRIDWRYICEACVPVRHTRTAIENQH